MLAQQIYPSHPQWNYVRFRLQLLLAHSNIQLLQVTKLPLEFDSTYEQYFKIDAAVDATSLSQQKIQSLRIRNYRDNLFQSGYIDKHINQNEQRILLFKLAVGKTLAVFKQSKSLDLGFPQDIDTIYFSDRQQELSLFSHQYRVKSPKQYAMEYDVVYKFTEKVKFDSTRQTCDYCRQNTAELYCIEDKEFFCKICYEEAHRSRQKAQHNKQSVTPFNSVPVCQIPTHHQSRRNIYCFTCQQLKCQTCMNKDHSNNHHQSIQVHKMASMFSQKQKSVLLEIKNKLYSQIKLVQRKLESLNSEYQLKQREMEQRFTVKLNKLREDATRQVGYAVGVHIQLRRKYDQYLWVQKFIQHAQAVLPTEQNIKMKEAFTIYIELNSAKETFLKMDKVVASL